MTDHQKLGIIKLLHTLIWAFMVSAIFFVVLAAISGTINTLTWLSVVVILLEGFVLAVFRLTCPLTVIARKYSNSTRANFDIFLPNWLAKYNKLIFTTIFILAFVLVIIRTV